MSAHPLATYVYKTFGPQFGGLLLSGYGEETSRQHRKLYITESESGVETIWVIELVSRRSPSRDEPLVLAALLKLLLSRPTISRRLEFEMEELIAELQWQDDASTRRQVEAAIRGYVRLLYDKQVAAQAGRHTSESAGGGYYHLLTGYVRGAKSGRTDAVPVRTLSGVDFDAGFVEGLRRGRVSFAGITFGALNRTGDEDRN